MTKNQTFPNRIRELRIKAGLSQQDLADLAETFHSQISDLETGRRGKELTYSWLKRLAPHLNCAPGELLLASDNASSLDDDEKHLLDIFRAASAEQRDQLLRVMEALVPQAAQPVRRNERAA